MFGNNLKLWVIAFVDPATTAVLERLNIPISAMLMYIILGRRFAIQQYIGIQLLLVGTVLTLYNPEHGFQLVSPFSLFLFATISGSSAMASVYSEKLLKGSGEVIHLANLRLYTFGLALNMIAGYFTLSSDATADFSLATIFMGFQNPVLWLQIAGCAGSGVAVSFVLRDFDSMVKNVCSALQIVVRAYDRRLHACMPVSIHNRDARTSNVLL